VRDLSGATWHRRDYMKTRGGAEHRRADQHLRGQIFHSWNARLPTGRVLYRTASDLSTMSLMGFTHIELMPDLKHPLTNMGYQPVGMLSPPPFARHA